METLAMTTIIQIKLETHQAIATSHGEGAAMGCNYQVRDDCRGLPTDAGLHTSDSVAYTVGSIATWKFSQTSWSPWFHNKPSSSQTSD